MRLLGTAALVALFMAPVAGRPALPPPDVALRIVAPSPRGPWTMRLDNVGPVPLRVAADARLLSIDVLPPELGARPVHCRLPSPLRPSSFPETRALYLAPGHSYVEQFEPEMFCFGKREAAALAGGAVVSAHLGWEPRRGAPFVVEDLAQPSELEPLHRVDAPTIVLRHEEPQPPPTEPAPAPPAPIDEKAPRLELSADAFVNARAPLAVVLHLRATNAGARPMHLTLLSRMASFDVKGPDGEQVCAPLPSWEAPLVTQLSTLGPGRSTRLSVIVEEACRFSLLRRPGFYRIWPSLHVNEESKRPGIVAFNGTATAKEPTRVRLLSGPLPYHAAPPFAVPTGEVEP